MNVLSDGTFYIKQLSLTTVISKQFSYDCVLIKAFEKGNFKNLILNALPDKNMSHKSDKIMSDEKFSPTKNFDYEFISLYHESLRR